MLNSNTKKKSNKTIELRHSIRLTFLRREEAIAKEIFYKAREGQRHCETPSEPKHGARGEQREQREKKILFR